MAGLIRDEDIATLREKARIDDVVASYVTLRNAGGGITMKDEVTPERNERALLAGYGSTASTIGALDISTIRAPATTVIATAPMATQYGGSSSTGSSL